MRVHVGTSGWQYRNWRGAFYPERLPQREWLPHYARAFASVEVNNTFYNLPSVEAVRHWREQTPAGFEFVLKGSRYLTHVRRLRDPEEPVRNMIERFRPLGSRFSVMLLQLPPRFRADPDRLEATLRAFPKRVRVAVESASPLPPGHAAGVGGSPRRAARCPHHVRVLQQRHQLLRAARCCRVRRRLRRRRPFHHGSAESASTMSRKAAS